MVFLNFQHNCGKLVIDESYYKVRMAAPRGIQWEAAMRAKRFTSNFELLTKYVTVSIMNTLTRLVPFPLEDKNVASYSTILSHIRIISLS